MPQRVLKKVGRAGRKLIRVVWRDAQPEPGQLTTLNFLANDICNSRCEMCLIWEKKKGFEVSPADLRRIISDPLFSELRYVGISGGEPTLRADLPELALAICEAAPKVKHVGIITNAINTGQVIERTLATRDACARHRVQFNTMVSLDGVGEVHDRVRGREGNFDSAVEVIRHLRDETDIPISIGCTITAHNVWDMDRLLEWCMVEKVYARFRVAEFINRLYNTGCTDIIRAFDEDERYHLALFFSRLEQEYEKDESVRATYRNIRGMLYEGRPRSSGCPYQSQAVCLSSKGGLAYCAPKAPNLGSCLEISAERLYLDNLHVREQVIKDHCPHCIHDYHAPPTAAERAGAEDRAHWQKIMSVRRTVRQAARLGDVHPRVADKAPESALIIGWYGTETAGDKAILGTIISRLRADHPDIAITVASLFPFVTRRTLRELGVEGAEIVDTFSGDYLETCEQVDMVIMGGGPLMGMEPLGFVLAAFQRAREAGARVFVEGCGVGPLVQKKHIRAVEQIIRLADEVRVRDQASLQWVIEHTGRTDSACSGDPAGAFVKAWQADGERLDTPIAPGHFACFVRELTEEYAGGRNKKEHTAFQARFEVGLGRLICAVRERTGLTPVLLPMHTFAVGKDDRVFARRFGHERLSGGDYLVADRVYSPAAILSAMEASPFSVCMRFHSVLFAETMGRPYVAIDYTGGGKIKGFLEDRDREHLCIDREEVAADGWQTTLGTLLDELPGFSP